MQKRETCEFLFWATNLGSSWRMDQNRSLGLGMGICYLVTARVDTILKKKRVYTILVQILYAHTYLSLWIMLSTRVGIKAQF